MGGTVWPLARAIRRKEDRRQEAKTASDEATMKTLHVAYDYVHTGSLIVRNNLRQPTTTTYIPTVHTVCLYAFNTPRQPVTH